MLGARATTSSLLSPFRLRPARLVRSVRFTNSNQASTSATAAKAAQPKVAIVLGGAGALGRAARASFLSRGWHVVAVDLSSVDMSTSQLERNVSVVGVSPEEQPSLILQALEGLSGSREADAVVCLAGGWAGGSPSAPSMIQNARKMMRSSVDPSLVAVAVAAKALKDGGILVLPGAHSALNPSQGGGMLGYTVAKAAVHALVKAVAGWAKFSGKRVVGLLPRTLDTPANRQSMPDADTSTWTKLHDVGEELARWAEGGGVGSGVTIPESGALVSVLTDSGVTRFETQ